MPATPTIRRVTSVRGTRGFIALPQVDPGQRVWCKSSPHARTLLWERSALLEVRRSGAIRIDCLRSPASILDAADVVVDRPAGLVRLLSEL